MNSGTNPSAPPPSYDASFQPYPIPNAQSFSPQVGYPPVVSQSREEIFRAIVQKYEIGQEYSNKLQMLTGFKVVFIFDDSGSMSAQLEDSPLNNKGSLIKVTRWDELQYYSSISLEIATLFSPQGCDIYFLNRGVVRNVTHANQLLFKFQNPPSGFTPLRDTFNAVLNDNLEAVREKKLLVMILTDGEPTDAHGRKSEVKEFKMSLKHRKPIENIFVTIVACTDDDNSIEYLDKWDREIRNLDVVDDYRSEREQVKKAKGNRCVFSYGDYVVKSLIGSIDPKLDRSDEGFGRGCQII